MTKEQRIYGLKKARTEKNDEFYTQLSDIEKELAHYTDHFKDKIVYCNCDDPRSSNFFNYFYNNFNQLQLKKLIVSCYINQNRDIFSDDIPERAMYIEYNGNADEYKGIQYFNGDGDFRSQESVDFLKQADIVVTNPPFSLFREYIAQLIEYGKDFIIIGHQHAVTYKVVFPQIKENKIRFGYGFKGGAAYFINSHYEDYSSNQNKQDGLLRVAGVVWYTNLNNKKQYEDLPLFKVYKGNESEYPTYHNYNAIEVSKVKNIPMDYAGMMGVPVTFIHKYNPNQFEIIGLACDKRLPYPFVCGEKTYLSENHKNFVGMVLNKNGKLTSTYARIIIRNRNPVQYENNERRILA